MWLVRTPRYVVFKSSQKKQPILVKPGTFPFSSVKMSSFEKNLKKYKSNRGVTVRLKNRTFYQSKNVVRKWSTRLTFTTKEKHRSCIKSGLLFVNWKVGHSPKVVSTLQRLYVVWFVYGFSNYFPWSKAKSPSVTMLTECLIAISFHLILSASFFGSGSFPPTSLHNFLPLSYLAPELTSFCSVPNLLRGLTFKMLVTICKWSTDEIFVI